MIAIRDFFENLAATCHSEFAIAIARKVTLASDPAGHRAVHNDLPSMPDALQEYGRGTLRIGLQIRRKHALHFLQPR
jgi:hypothetical protein